MLPSNPTDRLQEPSGRMPLAVFLIALALRLVAQLELSGSWFHDLLLGDAQAFDAWARELAAGDWMGHGVFYQAPLYPYFLGVVYALLAPEPLFARAVQAVLGALGCALVASSARRLHSPKAGWIAGLACAAYGPAIAHDGMIQKASLAFFLSALFLRAAVAFASHPGGGRALAAGMVLGLLALTRENALILLVPLVAWLTLSFREATTGTRLSWAFSATFGLALVLAPVAWRNYAVGGVPLPTASNAGVNFYLGNGPEADGMYRPLVAGRGHPEHEAEDARRLAEEAVGRPLAPHEVSRYWFAQALGGIAQDPLGWVELLGKKLRLATSRAEIMDAEALEVHRDSSTVIEVGSRLVHFGVLFPLALAGLFTRRRTPWGPTFVAACAVFLFASLVLFFVNGRFRIGLVPFLAPLAAAGLLELLRAAREKRYGRLALPATLLVAAGVLCNVPPKLAGDPRATTMSNASRVLLDQGRTNEAVHWGEEAVRRDPEGASAHYNLAEALMELGRNDEAREHFLEAARLEPAYAADTQDALARLAAGSGDMSAALRHSGEAVTAAPDEVRLRFNRALVLRRANLWLEAEVEYREVLRRDPTYVEAWNNLAWLLIRTGREPEAREAWENALAVDGEHVLALRQLAWLLATSQEDELRDGGRAVELAQRLLQVAPEREPGDLEILAAALAEAGRFEEAARTEEEALRLFATQGPAGAEGEPSGARARLDAYRARQPLRLAPPELPEPTPGAEPENA